jgi:hypothetical protein
MPLVRKLGFAYFALFVIVAAMSHVPQFKDADGVLGLLTGSGYLDFGIFINGVLDLGLTTRMPANLPHPAIGGFAAYAGFVLSKHHGEAA